jgi:hypothetical protein
MMQLPYETLWAILNKNHSDSFPEGYSVCSSVNGGVFTIKILEEDKSEYGQITSDDIGDLNTFLEDSAQGIDDALEEDEEEDSESEGESAPVSPRPAALPVLTPYVGVVPVNTFVARVPAGLVAYVPPVELPKPVLTSYVPPVPVAPVAAPEEVCPQAPPEEVCPQAPPAAASDTCEEQPEADPRLSGRVCGSSPIPGIEFLTLEALVPSRPVVVFVLDPTTLSPEQLQSIISSLL